MKVFVTGVCGQLGHDVINELGRRGHEGIGSDIQQGYAGIKDSSYIENMRYVGLDITDPQAVKNTLFQEKPDAIIHCAAWTAVDAAEEKENQETVNRINHLGTDFIAEAAKAIDAKLLYLSTDYVFDGKGTEPWKPDCRDYSPLNVYGKSKLEIGRAHV